MVVDFLLVLPYCRLHCCCCCLPSERAREDGENNFTGCTKQQFFMSKREISFFFHGTLAINAQRLKPTCWLHIILYGMGGVGCMSELVGIIKFPLLILAAAITRCLYSRGCRLSDVFINDQFSFDKKMDFLLSFELIN